MGLASVSFMHLTPTATALGEMMQKNIRYMVKGHSRSPLLVPIESLYSTSLIKKLSTFH